MTLQNVIIHLGPHYVMAGGKVLGKADDLSLDIAEATEEEMKILKNARIILLLKVDVANSLKAMKEHNNAKRSKRTD